MKSLSLIIFLFINTLPSRGQTLGGYFIKDYLSSAIHPNGCTANFVLGMPDDSIWVNLGNNTFINGIFSNFAVDSIGPDLLLETGFHPSNYNVSLLLSNGTYSLQNNVDSIDWQKIDSVTWKFLFTNCAYGTLYETHYIVPLDFNTDFALSLSDTVVGIKIELLNSVGVSDFAGAYIISAEQVGLNSLTSDFNNIIYPNPFTDQINYFTNDNSESKLIIYDNSLNICIQRSFINTISIETQFFAKGVYLYELTLESGLVKSGVIIKE